MSSALAVVVVCDRSVRPSPVRPTYSRSLALYHIYISRVSRSQKRETVKVRRESVEVSRESMEVSREHVESVDVSRESVEVSTESVEVGRESVMSVTNQ